MSQDLAHLDPDIVQRAVTMANGTAANISGHHQKLNGPVTALAGSWEGEAYRAFVPVYQQWEQGVQRLVRALNELADNTSVSVNDYVAADQQRGSHLTSVAGHSPFGGALTTT